MCRKVNVIGKRFDKKRNNFSLLFNEIFAIKKNGLLLLIEKAVLLNVPTPRPIREFFDLLLITLLSCIRNQH